MSNRPLRHSNRKKKKKVRNASPKDDDEFLDDTRAAYEQQSSPAQQSTGNPQKRLSEMSDRAVCHSNRKEVIRSASLDLDARNRYTARAGFEKLL
eukprot:6871640-Pyramimonas_sp.AAC.1